MKQFKYLILFLFFWLSEASSSEIFTGRISDNYYDYYGFCAGTLIENNKVITNHHCILDKNEEPLKKLYFHIKLSSGKIKTLSLILPDYIKLYDIGNVDNLTKDIIYLDFEDDIPVFLQRKAPKQGCKTKTFKLYTSSSKDKFCIVKEWESGIFTTNNCIFEKGLSGTPLYSDSNKTRVCGIYSLTINNKKTNTGIGVAIKLKEE